MTIIDYLFTGILIIFLFYDYYFVNCSYHACVVDVEWLSGRMPDSRAKEHRHEYSYGLHIGAVDGDSLWRCYAMTTQNHCTCYFVINRDLFDFIICVLATIV